MEVQPTEGERALHRRGRGEGELADVRLETLRAKQHREEDARVHEVNVVHRGGAVAVVAGAQVGVGEHMVRLRELRELLGCLGVAGVPAASCVPFAKAHQQLPLSHAGVTPIMHLPQQMRLAHPVLDKSLVQCSMRQALYALPPPAPR